MIYVLDASAIIAWLRDEPGADVVDNAIKDINSQCIAHAINLCEVYYDAHHKAGETHAESGACGLDSRQYFIRRAACSCWRACADIKAARRYCSQGRKSQI